MSLLLSLEENAPEGAVDVYLDAPTEEQGGTKIGSVAFSAAPAEETGTDGRGWASYASEMETPVSGIHGVYFVFRAESDEMIGAFDAFTFSIKQYNPALQDSITTQKSSSSHSGG